LGYRGEPGLKILQNYPSTRKKFLDPRPFAAVHLEFARVMNISVHLIHTPPPLYKKFNYGLKERFAALLAPYFFFFIPSPE